MTAIIDYSLARLIADDVYGRPSAGLHGVIPPGWTLDTTFNSLGPINGTGDPGELRLGNGFYAYALKSTDPNDSHRILAFRGTEDARDWLANFTDIGEVQFAPARNRLNEWLAQQLVDGNRVELVGHSLGGALVQWTVNATNHEQINLVARGLTGNQAYQVDPSLLHFTTFNAPGIRLSPGGLQPGNTTTVVDGEHHVIAVDFALPTPGLQGDFVHLLGGRPVGGTIVAHRVDFNQFSVDGNIYDAHLINKPWWNAPVDPGHVSPFAIDFQKAQVVGQFVADMLGSSGQLNNGAVDALKIGLVLGAGLTAGTAFQFGTQLSQLIQGVGADLQILATRLLAPGTDGLQNGFSYLLDLAQSAGRNVATFTLDLSAAALTTWKAIAGLSSAVITIGVEQLGSFVTNTTAGIGNAVIDLISQVPSTFNLGRSLNFTDLSPFTSAYAQALDDRTLAPELRTALEQAQTLIEHAGQTVVVQQGIGPNPFETPGFDPAATPLATGTVKEKGVNTFTAYLPYQAGTSGQSVQLKLNGLGANTVTVLSGGQELTLVNGVVTLVIPEGQKELQFALRAQDLSADVTVSLVAQLVDGTDTATHLEHQEATITAVNTPAINYANGFPSQVYIGTEFDDIRDLLVLANHEAHGNGGSDLIFSVAGNDQLYGDAGNDSLFGFVGQDQLYGGLGRDLLIADFRDDYVPPSGEVAGQDVVDGGAEDDVVAGGGGDDQLIGGTGNDHLWGDNLVEGDGANPGDPGSGLRGTYFFRVANTPGDDELDGGEGDDLLLGNLGDDVLLGGAGADTLFGDQVPEDSGAPVAFLTVSGGADFLDGGDGNDLLQGDGGDDVLWGGDGHDQLYGDDRIAGAVTPGDDWLEGGAGDDLLVGGAGSDLLDGGADNDQLFGEEGDDVLDGGDGIDQLSGGIGNDDLYGGAGNDVLAGHEGADTLLGEAGADQLDGGNDNDELWGGSGNDVLFGQAGDDYLDGEENDDELQGGAGNDELVGAVGNDRLFGEAGNDTLWGDDGDDLLDGGEGTNLLLGGDGNDTIFGGSGVDELDGGMGNDVLTGGAGADTFVFTAGSGQDTIVDGTAEDRVHTGLRSDEVTVGRSGNNLVLVVPGTTNQLTMKDFFLAPAQQLGEIQFGDGVVQGVSALIDHARSVIGTAAGDTLVAPTGLDGILVGLGGDDALFGQDGDDLLDGGTGIDHLEGSAGNDTYVFGRGYGIDTIQEDDFLGTNIDTVQFLAGVRPEDVTVRGTRVEDSFTRDLELLINGTNDVLRVTAFSTICRSKSTK